METEKFKEEIEKLELKRNKLLDEIIKIEQTIATLKDEKITYKNETNLIKITLRDVAKKYWVWEFEILWKSRKKEIVSARKEFIFLLRLRYKYTFEKIANILWWRNHASILYLYNQYLENDNKNKNSKTKLS